LTGNSKHGGTTNKLSQNNSSQEEATCEIQILKVFILRRLISFVAKLARSVEKSCILSSPLPALPEAMYNTYYYSDPCATSGL
jgi:hypothetical protein